MAKPCATNPLNACELFTSSGTAFKPEFCTGETYHPGACQKPIVKVQQVTPNDADTGPLVSSPWSVAAFLMTHLPCVIVLSCMCVDQVLCTHHLQAAYHKAISESSCAI